jgi:hypothetical protein
LLCKKKLLRYHLVASREDFSFGKLLRCDVSSTSQKITYSFLGPCFQQGIGRLRDSPAGGVESFASLMNFVKPSRLALSC